MGVFYAVLVSFWRSDLVAMYAHENLVNLTHYALPLEEFVRQEEERSAHLVATLLPKYHASGERASHVFHAKDVRKSSPLPPFPPPPLQKKKRSLGSYR